jgi:PAS domain S-box-containing protein
MTATITVLNVDDYKPALYARSRLLQRAGYNVLEASTGQEALRLVKARRPELVLLDVNLPDISGFDVCRRIKANPESASTLVVHVSATSTLVESRVTGLAGGADAYLAEPMHPQELLAQVEALLRLRNTEHALRRSHARIAEILENIADGYFATDNEWRVTDVNRAALKCLFRRRLEDVLGRPLWDLYPGTDVPELRGRCEAAMSSAQPQHFEAKFPTLDRWFDLHVYPCEAGLEVYLRDITDRKHGEEELERLYDEARAANRAKDAFLAVTSHELRTPLNAIMGWLQILRSGRLDEAQAGRALDIIARNTSTQLRLIEDLLDLSRIVSGRASIVKAPTDLRPLVETAAETVRPTAVAKGIQLVVDLEPRPALVRGDASRLQQVLNNLLSNSVKFTGAEGSIQVALTSSGGMVQFSVTDTGEGIDPEFLPYVFDRFRQADEETVHAGPGLGIGLWVARYFVEAHGGTISASSAGKGQGAAFLVCLPIHQASADAEPTMAGQSTSRRSTAT